MLGNTFSLKPAFPGMAPRTLMSWSRSSVNIAS